MRKVVITLVSIAVVCAIVIALFPGVRDELRWWRAVGVNTVESLEGYLQAHPRGKYVHKAKNRIEKFHWEEANRAYTVESFERYLGRYRDTGQYAVEAQANIAALRTALQQSNRALEGTVKTINKSARTLTITTTMGKEEILRLTDDTRTRRKEEERSLSDLSRTEGVRIDYINLPGGTLLARKISLGYTVSHCSCGDDCGCSLSRGCRAIRY